MPGEYDEGLDNDQGNPEVEKSARALGWVPQDKFKGNPEKWVDAQEFMDRADNLMPILRENNRRLKADLLTRDTEIGTLKDKLQGMETAVEKLQRHYTDANKRAVENAKRQLKDELKQAREDNDVDAELEIQERLDAVRKTEQDLAEEDKKKKDPPPNTPEDKTDPEVKAWAAENPWFGQDKKKTKAFLRLGEDLRDDGLELTGREFLEECLRVYEEQYGEEEPEPKRRQISKVEGTGNGARGGKGKNSWGDLPKEAQQACLDDVDTLVGPNKKFKTVDEWKKEYVKIYYSE